MLVIWLKKIDGELVCNKKNLKAEKKFITKECFQCFNIPIILIESVYRKDENLFPKMFTERSIHNFLLRGMRNFGFCGLGSSSWNITKLFQKVLFPKI